MNIGGKQFMNIQEAVGWLLKNNALPFQCNVNYVANTEIAKTAIINPSPAEIKVGALVLFADSKIGTVSGLTSNGFMVGSEYTDIKNALAYIVSVSLNASNHLIVTLSDGTVKDAGLVKTVSSISINSSMHLIVSYNDGTTNDAGSLGDFSSVDFVAKTLKQTNVNYGVTPNPQTGLVNTSITNIYNRSEEINNVLYLIFNTKLSFSGTVNMSDQEVIAYCNIGLTTAVASAIFDLAGVSAHDSPATTTLVASVPCEFTTTIQGTLTRISGRFDIMNITTANYLGMRFTIDGAHTFNNGDNLYLTARAFLTLI